MKAVTGTLHKLHEGTFGAHLGENKTLYRVKESFYWPGHLDDLESAVKLVLPVQPGRTRVREAGLHFGM